MQTIKKLKPLLLVFTFIILASFVRQIIYGYDAMLLMMDFMGIFFIVFGAFKLYNLRGFVEGFMTYDIIAKRSTVYAYLFPFIELAIGALYLLGYMFLIQNIIVLVIAALGIYSAYDVIQNKRDIKCVCLGTLFTLPMTWVTFIENLVMFVMVIFMILGMLWGSPKMNMNMHMMMSSMTANLQGKSGKELEKAFITEMIPHHQGAVDMAKILLVDQSISAELRAFAQNIISAQESEIKQMEMWLRDYK